MAVTKKTFEQSMSRLEEIVAELERGECDLERSLKLFEEGAALAGACGELLDKAEQKVALLTSSGEEVPFQGEE